VKSGEKGVGPSGGDHAHSTLGLDGVNLLILNTRGGPGSSDFPHNPSDGLRKKMNTQTISELDFQRLVHAICAMVTSIYLHKTRRNEKAEMITRYKN
jgi:hypothetical protein